MWHGIGMQWHISLHLCMGTSHDMGVSTWYGSTLCLVFDGGLGTVGRRPKSRMVAYMEMKICVG